MMHIDQALLVLSDWPVRDALDAVRRAPDGAVVVIRLTRDDVDVHFVFDAGTLRIGLGGRPTDARVGEVFRLADLRPNRTVELDDDEAALGAGDVVVQHRQVLGVVRVPGSTRSAIGSPTRGMPPTGAGPGSDPEDSPPRGRGGSGSGGSEDWEVATADPGGDGGADDDGVDPGISFGVGTGGGAGGGGGGAGARAPVPGGTPGGTAGGTRPPAAPRRFRAFAAIEAPPTATVGERFELTVGFAARPQTGESTEQPILVANAPEQLTFVVQVAGFGFAFPEGIRRPLVVPRDTPTGPRASFLVEAGEVTSRFTRTLEVSFEYDGELCGYAWHDVMITAAPAAATSHPVTATALASAVGEPASDPARVRSGGTGITVDAEVPAPSLTVEIRSEPGSPDLEWVFHPREAVERPAGRVLRKLEAPSAQVFAEQLMAQLPAASGAVSLPTVVRGMGKLVNRVVPEEFWAMVEATWRVTPAGTTPSLLLTTNEPFVPWELAWVDGDVVDTAVLPDGVTEGPLGALWRVGRWVPPVRRRRGPDRPAAPPTSHVDVEAMAVVIGDYAADTKIRDLPHAIEEGNAITLRYRGLPLTASEGDVDLLMKGALERDGAPYQPTVVHFASHGQVSVNQPQYTGILLQGGRKLDLLMVEGSTLGRAGSPFVFLNACQVGTASTILSTYGGLAGAFLGTGCRGFVAPLWNVDDDVAKDIALTFYQRTLGEGVPVGEAVRQIRAGFGDGAGGTATPLSYVFYGHPDLVLNRAGDGPDPGEG